MAVDKEVEFSKGKQQGFRAKLNGFCSFIWNGETNEFLGRNAKSWALIGVYYLIFYSCLAGFFAVNLLVFFTGISDTEPKLQEMDTLLKGHPGMGFRPMVNEDNTLIAFERSNSESIDEIMKKFDTFLAPYNNQSGSMYQDCDENTPAVDGKVCKFDLTQLGNCTRENFFGYKEGKPCVLIKLNKIYGWLPKQLSNNTDCTKESDKTCPEVAPKHIGLTCEGEADADKDFINSTTVSPAGGFPFHYYPYKNQKGYLAPLVAVQFEVRKGALVMIWCKAWADNIYRHKNDRAGSVHFELMVEE